jgi:SNF2-related domain
MEYGEFLSSKSPIAPLSGLTDVPALPDFLKSFQKAAVGWALRRGRAALFEGTGLGKTVQQLVWSDVVVTVTGGRIIILCPLAVAEQTVQEAAKFGIPGVGYAADQSQVGDLRIVVTNYERFHLFDISYFVGIVLDESGIIRSEDGAYRKLLTESCVGIAWKLCCTATPAPNDYTELGQHAEFLGVMTAKEMLSMFFVHDGSVRANDATQGTDGWRLKGHATKDFWRWLASWSIVVRHPRDLGFDEPGYDLPPLNLHQITVRAEYKPTGDMLFPMPARTLGERIGVRKDTAGARVDAAVEIVQRFPGIPWLVWCHLNKEADAIEKLLDGALQVSGTQLVEVKIARLLGFKEGRPLILVTKPGIGGRGLNLQHCCNMVFVGLTDSFEAVYQAIRRCWRFGQLRPVNVYFVASELEGAVVANLKRKELAFDIMLDAMAGHMRDLQIEQIRGGRVASDDYNPTIPMEVPTWLTTEA